jgi:hypothetical protein
MLLHILCTHSVQEEESDQGVDSVLCGTRVFECAPKKAYFELLAKLHKDRRFVESSKFVHRMPDQRKYFFLVYNMLRLLALAFGRLVLGLQHICCCTIYSTNPYYRLR